MRLLWTRKAQADLVRIHDFLADKSPSAAARAVRSLVRAVERLQVYPRLGETLEEFAPREVRRIFAGSYEMRYEVGDTAIHVLRIWHARENR